VCPLPDFLLVPLVGVSATCLPTHLSDLSADLSGVSTDVSTDLHVYLPAGLVADQFVDLFDLLVGLSLYLFVAPLVSLFDLSADMSSGLSIDH
jgi:hypothetical protein